jgi:hypothetical protein
MQTYYPTEHRKAEYFHRIVCFFIFFRIVLKINSCYFTQRQLKVMQTVECILWGRKLRF